MKNQEKEKYDEIFFLKILEINFSVFFQKNPLKPKRFSKIILNL